MKTNKRKQPERNRFFTGVINAILLSVAWWVIVVFVAIKVTGS